MALATYTDLLAAPNTWLRRSDLSTVAPDFVTLAEAVMNRELNTSLQLVKAAYTINAEFVDKPPAFRSFRTMRLTSGTGSELLEMTPEQMTAAKAVPNPVQAEPRFYSAVGAQLEFWPIPNGTYTAAIEYQTGITPLSLAAPSNWILANFPDAYLFGTLAAACAYVKQDQRAGEFQAQLLDVLGQVQRTLRTTYDRTLRADPGLMQRRRASPFNIYTGD